MSTAKQDEGNGYHHGALREALLARAAEVIEAEGLEALTLRGLARDLGVSHGAPNRHFRSREDLLAALAAEGFARASAAMLAEMDAVGDDARVRLNAMGRGYLRWALRHRALFRVMSHPDIVRFADADLRERRREIDTLVHECVLATQAEGRHPDVDPELLTLYTMSVPWGVALLLNHPTTETPVDDDAIDELVARVIELVVPVATRA